MKPTKVKVADVDRFRGDTFWGKVLMKLKKLGTAIEMNKEEMEQANEYWRIYGK